MDNKAPAKLDNLMYGLMKKAQRQSFMEFIECWDITYEEYEAIANWFKAEFDIEL